MFNPFQSFSPKNNRLFALSESDFFLFSLLCIVFKDRPSPLLSLSFRRSLKLLQAFRLVRFALSNPLSRDDVC